MVGYGAQAVAIVSLYALFVLWSLAVWLGSRPIRFAPAWDGVIATGSLIGGPLLAGVFLTSLLWLIPANDWLVYLSLLYGLPSAGIIYGLRKASRSGAMLLVKRAITFEMGSIIILIGTALFAFPFVLLALQLTLLPLHGNDPLEYMQLGRALYEHRDARIYPILTALPSSGFVAPWTHPPTYGMLIAIAFALQGSAAVAGAAKLIGLWFALSTSLLVAALVFAADKRASWRVWMTPFLVLTVPLYFELVQNGHIDAFRLATFTLAIALASHFIIAGTRSAAVFAGLGIGFAMLSHSIGILAPAIALPLMLVCWRKGLTQLLISLALASAVAVALAAPHYVRNIAIFGNAIQDNVPVWDIEALRVTEFLRVTRGLETLFDRLYIGIINTVLQPATLGYITLVGVLLVPALVWVKAREQGLKGMVLSLFKGRGDSLVTHLGVAIAGYAALIILSAVAGSDLAVKNARYILTIVPLAVAATMIGIGHIIDDENFSNAAKSLWSLIMRYVDMVRRFGPRKFHPPVRHAQVVDAVNGWKPRLTHLAGLAVVVAGVFIVQAQVFSSFRIFNGYVRVYYNSTALLFDRLLESEQIKRNGSILDDALVDVDIKDSIAKSDLVLSFRQASLGFYTTRQFRFHADHLLVDLFKIRSPADLHQQLLAKNIRWIHTPNYPLPEINNSAFANLIADQNLIRPVVRSSGWALYALRESQSTNVITTLGKATPYVKTGIPLYATTETGSGMVDGRRARMTLDPATGVAELRRDRDIIKQLNRWDVLLSRPAVTQSSPVDLNASDFVVSNDPVKIKARVSGRGFAEIAVEYVSYPPVLAANAGSQLTDFRSYKPKLTREVIWSGVLGEEPWDVAGWLTPAISPDSAPDVMNLRRGARILFRLRDGEVLRVHSWEAESFSILQDQEKRIRVAKAVSNGWLFSPTTLHESRGTLFRTPKSELPPSQRWPFAPVGVERLTSAPIAVALPPVYLPDQELSEVNPGSAMVALEKQLASGSLRLEFKTGLKGYGQVLPVVSVVCAVSRQGQNDELIQWSEGGRATTGEKTLTKSATPLQLWGDRIELITLQETLPCVPRSIRLLLQNGPQKQITLEERLRNPERQRLGFIDIHTAEAKLIGVESSGKTTSIPLQIRPVSPDLAGEVISPR
jgi:hypothetical protein